MLKVAGQQICEKAAFLRRCLLRAHLSRRQMNSERVTWLESGL